MVFSGSWQVSLTSACSWNIHGWMSFRWEVNCPPLYEQCWGMQKECSGFLHLIKSSHMYHLFLCFLPCSLLKHHRTFVSQKQIALLFALLHHHAPHLHRKGTAVLFLWEASACYCTHSVIYNLKISGIIYPLLALPLQYHPPPKFLIVIHTVQMWGWMTP